MQNGVNVSLYIWREKLYKVSLDVSRCEKTSNKLKRKVFCGSPIIKCFNEYNFICAKINQIIKSTIIGEMSCPYGTEFK